MNTTAVASQRPHAARAAVLGVLAACFAGTVALVGAARGADPGAFLSVAVPVVLVLIVGAITLGADRDRTARRGALAEIVAAATAAGAVICAWLVPDAGVAITFPAIVGVATAAYVAVLVRRSAARR